MKPFILIAVLLVQTQQSGPEKPPPRRPATPNLDALAAQNSALKRTVTFQAFDPSDRAAFQLDHTMEIYPTYFSYKYVFVMPSGEIYSLKSELERDSGAGKTVLQLPDHSSVTAAFKDPKKGTVKFAKLSMPLDASQSHKKQYDTDEARTLKAALPESGKVFVGSIDHLRGDLCREASLCRGMADALLDLFRDQDDVEADVGPDTKNDSGWRLKVLSEGKTIEPLTK